MYFKKRLKISNEVFATANYKYVDHNYESLLPFCEQRTSKITQSLPKKGEIFISKSSATALGEVP